MLGHLEVIDGPDKGRTFPFQEGDAVPIGRGPASATKLADPCVSRLHCRLEVSGGRPILTDAGGAGGTLVNGRRIERHELLASDEITIGNTRLRVYLPTVHEDRTVIQHPAATTQKPTALPLEVGALTGAVLGRYEVGPALARGRSSMVFQARDTASGAAVALKVLLPDVAASEDDAQRFCRAMKMVLPLRHPNLVAVHDWGRDGPFLWSAVEFVEGESLRQVIQRIGTAGILDWRHALRVAVHVGRALDFAHGQGIVHRNVTPPNILVRTADRLTKLGDLMLAKALEGGDGAQITRRGELVGDLAYMAPERTRGTAVHEPRSDLYGLGATVYALLTGRPPCEGASVTETIRQIRDVEPPRPRTVQLSVPEAFDAVVMLLLAKRAEDRPRTAADLVAELEKIARGHGLAVG